jgi:hypothetical protein
MLRSILAIVVSYVVMFVFAFAVFTSAYLGLGVERVFEPGSYDVSTIWIVLLIVIDFVAFILAGVICAAISKSKRTCMVFAIIVLVLGLIVSIPTAMKEHSAAARSGDVSNYQAMTMAQTPPWLCFLNPVLGAVGVMLGARMKKLPVA